MLNELRRQLRRYDMLQKGDRVVCAVSGGADSMALLWGLYLLREELEITLQAAHFDHQLRGAQSQRDAAFVAQFCRDHNIPLDLGTAPVRAGKKGLEAAAREARYSFFDTLPGKIATAHTADDNAETVLLHLVRGTGLRGLGGITPVNGRIIRPLLTATRQQVLRFLREYSIPYVEDSSNDTDAFLRNRLRHHVMPLLKAENPRLAENVSAMAMELRQDAQALEQQAAGEMPGIAELRALCPAVRSRYVERFLKESGVPEPERRHVELVEGLIFSPKPSASADLPGGITLARCYDRLTLARREELPEQVYLPEQGSVRYGAYRVSCGPAEKIENTGAVFTVVPRGRLYLRGRREGDSIRLPGGTKSLKKLFIDRKIPAARRPHIPVLCDDGGVVAVCGIGTDEARKSQALPAVQVRLEIEK